MSQAEVHTRNLDGQRHVPYTVELYLSLGTVVIAAAKAQTIFTAGSIKRNYAEFQRRNFVDFDERIQDRLFGFVEISNGLLLRSWLRVRTR